MSDWPFGIGRPTQVGAGGDAGGGGGAAVVVVTGGSVGAGATVVVVARVVVVGGLVVVVTLTVVVVRGTLRVVEVRFVACAFAVVAFGARNAARKRLYSVDAPAPDTPEINTSAAAAT